MRTLVAAGSMLAFIGLALNSHAAENGVPGQDSADKTAPSAHGTLIDLGGYKLHITGTNCISTVTAGLRRANRP